MRFTGSWCSINGVTDTGADARDVELLKNSSDGELFKVTGNLGDMREIRFGGPDAANYQFMQALKELADWGAGNLSILGGLAPQSKTASQDKMLNENSSRMVADLSGTTVKFITDVSNALCWYWWHDPYKVMQASWSPAGMPGLSVSRSLTPQQRMQTPWTDLRVRIDPYSMSHKTPESRLAFLNAVVEKLAPMNPLFAQMGWAFRPDRYLQLIADLGDEPEATSLYQTQQPLQAESSGDGMGHGTTMPPNTTRTYERRSLGGDTSANRLSEIGNQMSAEAASGDGGGY